MSTEPVRVGVLSFHTSKETKAILNAVEALGHETEWLREENVLVRFRGDAATLEPDVDVVANRLLLSNTDQPTEELAVAATLAAFRPMLNEPAATMRASHKIATAARLALDGIPLPHTVLALGGQQLNSARGEFGEEAVYKTAIGTHGGGAWKVGASESLVPRVGRRRAFLQELVRKGERPTDLRVYVVGDEGWYVLEVNPTAGFRGLYEATGRSPAPYIAAMAVERGGGAVEADRVEELAATLDDSTPSCVPAPGPDQYEAPTVVGLTERVVVSGTTGTRTVVGRADTDTARTSVGPGLAADVGAGPIHTVGGLRSGEQSPGASRPVVDLVVGIGGDVYTIEATLEEHSGATHPLLLGRDVLKHYYLDVSRTVDGGAVEPDEPDEE
jgi:glutathione synthase/RimK-type ligase-like ATP-grasp enzyme